MTDRLIVALDFEDAHQATEIVEELGDLANFYKVGPKLFYETGPSIVRDLTGLGKKVFLDLKFHDIPATVKGAVRQAAAMGATFATAHVADGSAAAAAEEVARIGLPVQVLGVTVLTSTSQHDLTADGYSYPLEDLVLARARAAIEAGCAGIVCSANEVARLRSELGSAPILVTPGIRRETDAASDQARTSTPRAAIASGADYLVVGRPIIESPDPRGATEAILAEITAA
ncbi:MAG: orotidine-5'-phosphate decarboxylase [Acidobacteria bacterium]|nr:MAG: orotidine-5'-phosphate decarboxylase [Acidobacteriota bacterium]